MNMYLNLEQVDLTELHYEFFNKNKSFHSFPIHMFVFYDSWNTQSNSNSFLLLESRAKLGQIENSGLRLHL